MKRVTVRRHYRIGKNKKSVVRKHSRKAIGSKVEKIRSRYGINSPIGVKENNNGPEESYAFTDTVMENGEPMKHTINLANDKIQMAGESPEKIMHHELAHVIAKETKILSKPLGKQIIEAIKQTRAYSLLEKAGDSYEMQPEELFSRAYAQYKSGHATPNDVKTGYAWSPSDFKKVAALFKKLETNTPA